jgi:hypothetical protein
MALSSYQTTLFAGGFLVGELTNLAIGGQSLAEIDVTSLTSTDKQYTMGSLEPGSLTVDFFVPSNWNDFTTFLVPVSGDETPSVFQVSFADGAISCSFFGICTNLSISAEQDGAVTASATIKITSAITWS